MSAYGIGIEQSVIPGGSVAVRFAEKVQTSIVPSVGTCRVSAPFSVPFSLPSGITAG